MNFTACHLWVMAHAFVLNARELMIMTSNNQQLKQLQAQHNLTNQAVSDLLGCSKSAVDSWTCTFGTEKHRNMPKMSLAYLELLLKEAGK